MLGTGAGVLGGEGLATYLHPALGEALAVADFIVPLAVALILLTAILLGSNQTCDRVFRLLRWIDGLPEPPAPWPAPSTSPAPSLLPVATPATAAPPVPAAATSPASWWTRPGPAT